MEEEKDVKKIVIHYEDGTEKVIDKGFFCNMKEEDGSAVLEFTMCHVSGREIELIVEGCLQLGFKLGMFDSKKEEDLFYGRPLRSVWGSDTRGDTGMPDM